MPTSISQNNGNQSSITSPNDSSLFSKLIQGREYILENRWGLRYVTVIAKYEKTILIKFRNGAEVLYKPKDLNSKFTLWEEIPGPFEGWEPKQGMEGLRFYDKE